MTTHQRRVIPVQLWAYEDEERQRELQNAAKQAEAILTQKDYRVPEVSVADLVHHAEFFAGTRVRVKGLWATRMEESRLLSLDRDEKTANISFLFAATISEKDPVGQKKAKEAFRDFDLNRNYFRFYLVQIDCEGTFSWDKKRGHGLDLATWHLSVERVFDANHVQ